MRGLKRTFASVLMAFGILVGAVVVAPVATAAPAQALTVTRYETSPYCHYVTVWNRYDYNWWEETFQRKRDYSLAMYTYYRYNLACGTVRVL